MVVMVVLMLGRGHRRRRGRWARGGRRLLGRARRRRLVLHPGEVGEAAGAGRDRVRAQAPFCERRGRRDHRDRRGQPPAEGDHADLDGPECERAQEAARVVDHVAGGVEEDFGIAPLEVQACGTPVIAYGRGGVRETIVADGAHATGAFFDAQSADAIAAAVRAFEARDAGIDAADCRRNAERFGASRFRREMSAFTGVASARADDAAP